MTLSLFLAVVPLLASCDYLKDPEPWVATVFYQEGADGRLAFNPETIEANFRNGIVNVVNETQVERGFAVREAAVFELIPAGQSKNVEVTELKDDTVYVFEDHQCEELGCPKGQIVVNFVSEEFR
jgi:hypothetical protein